MDPASLTILQLYHIQACSAVLASIVFAVPNDLSFFFGQICTTKGAEFLAFQVIDIDLQESMGLLLKADCGGFPKRIGENRHFAGKSRSGRIVYRCNVLAPICQYFGNQVTSTANFSKGNEDTSGIGDLQLVLNGPVLTAREEIAPDRFPSQSSLLNLAPFGEALFPIT